MSVADIVTGNDISIAVQLKRNEAVFSISGSGTVQALLVSSDHKTVYLSTPADCSPAAPGALWATSMVVVEIPADSTAGIEFQGLAILEIKIVDPTGVGKKTWFVPVRIITGNIP